MQQALEAKPSSADGFVILSGAEKGFPGAVTQVLESWMVYLEAKALANQELSKTEVSRGVGLVQEKWSGHPAWLALEVGQDELKQVVERQLIVRAFEKLRNDPQLSPISDDDALLFYKKNRLRFGSLPFSSFKDNIKAYLIKQQTEKRLADWHENLRRKYKVRNFISG